MSVEPLRLHFLARTPSNCRHVNFDILSKDSPDFWCAFEDGEVVVIGDEPENTI
jgi:hypothetical protein